MKFRAHGVTLIELLVTMTIVGVLMALAVPSFRYVTTANRVASEYNGLLGDMQYARAEAIRRGLPVTVCPSVNSTVLAPACTATSNWQVGWIVFVDINSNQTVDNPGNVDMVLRAQKPFNGTDTLQPVGPAVQAFSFNRDGFTSFPAGGGTLAVHDVNAITSWTRCLLVSLAGGFTTLKYNGGTCL